MPHDESMKFFIQYKDNNEERYKEMRLFDENREGELSDLSEEKEKADWQIVKS